MKLMIFLSGMTAHAAIAHMLAGRIAIGLIGICLAGLMIHSATTTGEVKE